MSTEESGDHMENGQPIEKPNPLSAEEQRAAMEATSDPEATIDETQLGDHQRAALATAGDPNSMTLGAALKLLREEAEGKHLKHQAPGMRLNAGVEGEGKYMAPLGIDPRVVTHDVEQSDVGYVQCVVDTFSVIHNGLTRLGELREHLKKDASRTQGNQILMMAEQAEKLQGQMTRKVDHARKTLLDGIKALDSSLSAPITTDASHPLSKEVREYVSKLPDNKRMDFLATALKKNDLKTLHAVLGAHPYLSGLTDPMAAHFLRQLHEKQNPDTARRVQVMRKKLELLDERAGTVIFREIERCMGARWDVVAQLRKNHDRVAQAVLLLNNPV